MVTIQGTVEEIIFSNEINGYTICDISGEEALVTAVGYMPFIRVGECLKITGKWVTHPEYGEQLKVDLYEKILPQTSEAVEKYLASGVVKGVGPATAARIVERFGDETLEIIQYNPGRLSEIKGISHNKALFIGHAFEEQKELGKVVMFFQDYGISAACAAKIHRTFGENTIEEIKANPYKLADEGFGINFRTADRIARNLGVDPMSKYRICSGIKYAVSQWASNGHTYVPEDELKRYTSQLLEVGIEDIRDALITLVFDGSIFLENKDGGCYVYLKPFYNAEIGVCKNLARLSQVTFDSAANDFEERIDEIQRREGIVLAEKQKTAVREAMANGALVITGGPGTGKTTIIKTIISLLSTEGYDVALAAPTGRAAKRMTEATGFEARTIHRLLEIGYAPDNSEPVFMKNENSPVDADVIIIDEVSMVDILLMNHLLKAVDSGSRLILVGDVDQLPSVGAGNVLKDIIGSGMIKTVKLDEIFRQAEESMITVNAHRINKGVYPVLNRKDKDFFFLSRPSGEKIISTVVELSSKRLPSTYGYDPMRHIQVLTPTRKGPAGVYNLNIELQNVLNPKDERKNEKLFGKLLFREGDRVMQIKNNYNLKWERDGENYTEGQGVFNGDTGIITRIDSEEQRINVLFEDEKKVEYDYSILDELEPAFAVTVHKSQGSEFPVVILPLMQGPQVLMTRNLLYTAITRARDMVIMVGSEKTMLEMIENQRETLRYSDLKEKLKICFMGVAE